MKPLKINKMICIGMSIILLFPNISGPLVLATDHPSADTVFSEKMDEPHKLTPEASAVEETETSQIELNKEETILNQETSATSTVEDTVDAQRNEESPFEENNNEKENVEPDNQPQNRSQYQLETQEMDFPLGTPESQIKPESFVKSLKYFNQEVDSKNYKVEMLYYPSTSKTGTVWARIKVSTVGMTISYSEERTIRCQVLWGNTIASKAPESEGLDVAVSLLDRSGGARLVATEGSGLTTATSVSSLPTLSVFRNDETRRLVNASYQYLTPKSLLADWNTQFDKAALLYGDVLKYNVHKKNWNGTSGGSYKGESTWVSRNNSLVKETEGYENAYYELTPSGYRLLRLNQMEIKNGNRIPINTTKAEMNSKINDYITIPSHIQNANDYRMEFESVDTSSSGDKKSKINVYQKLASGGEFMVQHEVSYTVWDEIKIDLHENREALLGAHRSYIDPGQYISKVTVGNKVLDPKDYLAQWLEPPVTSKIGEVDSKLRVVLADKDVTPETSATASPKINVVWGNTIATKSVSGDNGLETSVSLHNDSLGPYLKATQGTGLSNSSSLSTRPDLYVYRNDEDNCVLSAEHSKTNETSTQLLSRWGNIFDSAPFGTIKYGDVMKYTVRRASNNQNLNGENTWVSRNNKLVLETQGYDGAYYELTSSGFRLMRLNQMTIKNDNQVLRNTTLAEMNSRISDFITIPAHIQNNKNYRMEFASVDTSSIGNKKSKINVYEKLDSGGEFKIQYEVSYMVHDLKIETHQNKDILLGTKSELLNPESFIKKVTYGNVEVRPTDYDVEFAQQPIPNKTGKLDLSLKVTLKQSKTTATEKCQANVIWGSTIVTKVPEHEALETSVSMLDYEGKPYLNANQGSRISTYNELRTRPDLAVFRNSESEENKVLNAPHETVGQSPTQLMNRWNTIFDGASLKYGDVMRYGVRLRLDGQNLKGNNTWISRNNELILETQGYNDAYYELTIYGYRLLRLNQLEIKHGNKILVNTSKAEMNRNIGDYITFPSHIQNTKDYRMEFESVDNSSSGDKESMINVYQKLESGGEFMVQYKVSYTVYDEMEIEFHENREVLLGTRAELIDPKLYIKKVTVGNKTIDPNDYVATFLTPLVTDKTGEVESEIKVQLKGENATPQTSVTVKPKINVVWGSTIATGNRDGIEASVSLLDSNGIPRLNANQGNGLANELATWPDLYVYRKFEDKDNCVLSAEHSRVDQTPKQLLNRWNGIFDKATLKYGDVMKYTVRNAETGENFKGYNTYVSRDNKLTAETVGYDNAYYELTSAGYRLMRLNQMTIKDGNEVLQNTSLSDMNKRISEFITIPSHIQNAQDYRMEFASIDTSSAGNKTSKINVYEKLESGGEFMVQYDVSYVVNELKIEVEQNIQVLLGTKPELLKPDSYIKKVTYKNVELMPDDYDVVFSNQPVTEKTGKIDLGLKVTLKDTEGSVIKNTQAEVIWGSTLATKIPGDEALDTSVSLLNYEGKPYLNANKGHRLSTSSSLGTRPHLSVYRGNEDKENLIVDAHYISIHNSPTTVMNNWNAVFSNKELNYGDVVKYRVQYNNMEDYKGANTWVSRDNKLTLETKGYEAAYYELTKDDGYHLIRTNQLTVNNGVSVPLGATVEEMNQRISEFITIPDHIPNPDDFTIRFKEVENTNTSGSSKKGVIEVSEELQSGGTFTLEYDVTFIVNPVVNEYFVDAEGNELKPSEHTEFDLGTTFLPDPEKFMTVDDVLYRYVGWKENKAGEQKDGKPSATDKERDYIYVYEVADKLIHVTVPIEMMFGTLEQTEEISSKRYEITNQSKLIGVDVVLNTFVEKRSDVHFLEAQEENPTQQTEAARLDLNVGSTLKVNSLNQNTLPQPLTTLLPEATEDLHFSGIYFGNLKKLSTVDYDLKLHFKPIAE